MARNDLAVFCSPFARYLERRLGSGLFFHEVSGYLAGIGFFGFVEAFEKIDSFRRPRL